nr:MAG TPA: tail protein [Caudoviricetes sp.]
MTLTFYRYGSTDTTDTLELDETKSSIIDKLNEPTRLSAILTSETAPQIALGNYTTYGGNRYYVTKESTVRKEHSQLYTVEVDLERSLGLARITILANPVDHRTTFDYTATATEHLQLIVDCLNAKYEEVGLKWTRGAVHCKDTVKHIKFDGATVLGALQQIREAYETDIFAEGETLSLGQPDEKTTALSLAYGKGKGLLSGLERHKHTDDTVPTRLYVTGTKRNMVKGRLTLEKDVVLAVDLKSGAIERQTGGVDIKPDGRTRYRTDKAGQYIAEWSPTDQFAQSWRRFPTEATYTNEEIYPSHVSTIRSVTKVKDHYEVNSDLNYTKLLIDGEQMQVVFQTGNLAGRDFDARHNASTGRLAIVPKEEDDTTLPNDTLCPKVGDQYIVTGVKLPDRYIREAERNLTNEALRHLIKLQETRYSYKADIDPVYLHNNHDTIAPQLAVGRYVRLADPQITIGDPYVRIVGKRTYLDRPYTPEIELSNEIEPPSELTRVLNELDRQDNGLISLLDRLHGFDGKLTFSSEKIHKLASELESHKTATDKSFAELSDHPLTIDKDGYWQVWSVKDSRYLTTQYQSRGRDGQDGKDGAKGDKGDKPVITLNDKYQLLADGQLLSQQSLKGAKGDKGETGARGATGATGAKGADGHNPSPEEVLGTSRFAELLGSEVTQQVKPVKDNLDTANTNISNLQKVALTPQQRTDLGYLTYSLQSLKSGSNGTLEGLTLQRYIALSGDNQTISAYLASNALPAVLKAGVSGFGTPNEREQVAINHNGTGHLGNLYFSGSQIDFRTSRDTDPYLSIGADENQFITEFLSTARLDDTPVSVGTVTLTTSTTSDERAVDVANDGTRLTVSIGDIMVATHRGATTRLTLDGEVLAEWRGNISISGGGSVGGIVMEPQYSENPYIASNLSYERVVKAGRHTLRIEIIKPTSGATATIRGLRVRRRYDTGAQQSALTKSGLRLFGSPDRYLDVDYRKEYEDYIPSMGMSITARNHYTVRIKGGAKMDRLTVDELDMPGVPLCGASFDESGAKIKSFGKRAVHEGTNRVEAVYDYGMRAYKVYHSIGNTNYIPIVQVSGWGSSDINWSLTPRVYDITSDYFVVRILTNNDNPQRKAISYVAYKTE